MTDGIPSIVCDWKAGFDCNAGGVAAGLAGDPGGVAATRASGVVEKGESPPRSSVWLNFPRSVSAAVFARAGSACTILPRFGSETLVLSSGLGGGTTGVGRRDVAEVSVSFGPPYGAGSMSVRFDRPGLAVTTWPSIVALAAGARGTGATDGFVGAGAPTGDTASEPAGGVGWDSGPSAGAARTCRGVGIPDGVEGSVASSMVVCGRRGCCPSTDTDSAKVVPHWPQKRAIDGTAAPQWGQGFVLSLLSLLTFDSQHTRKTRAACLRNAHSLAMKRTVRVYVLGSGSSGNALLVEACGTRVLVEAGVPPKILAARLAALGVELGGDVALDGILVSHQHGDHFGQAAQLAAAYGAPLFLHAGVGDVSLHAQRYIVGKPLRIGALSVMTTYVPHDTAQVAFRVDDGLTSFGIATDVGRVTQGLVGLLVECDAALVEANHCSEMLAFSEYPDSVKRRIGGGLGHLSNEQTAELAARLVGSRMTRLWLGHLSRSNNTEARALEVVAERARRMEVAIVPAAEPVALVLRTTRPRQLGLPF